MPDPLLPIGPRKPITVNPATPDPVRPAPDPPQPAVHEAADAPLATFLSGVRPGLNLTAVDRQNVVTVNGQVGLFTPLTHQPGTPPDAAAEKNIQTLLTSLQREVAGLSRENLRLKGQLGRFVDQPRSPEDFASAVRRSLDKLQTQLSAMTNPVCNFAVRQFRLETNVHVAVTPLGDVEYRFVSFDEKPDPNTLSRLVLDLAPTPKQTTAGTFTPELFKPATAVSQVDGLSADDQAALHQNQIDTVGDLIAVGTRARGSVQLAALLKTDRDKLAGWVTSAELLTVQGIDGGRATVLSQAGIGSMSALAGMGPDDLVKQFSVQLAKAPRNDVKPIEASEAALMIRAAKAYLGQKDSVPAPNA